MKKRILAIVLTGVMMFGLAACGSSSSSGITADSDAASADAETTESDTADSEEAAFTIGYPAMTATNTTMEAMRMNREAVAEGGGGELITEDWDFSPEGTISAVEKLIERGCDGIIVTPTDESILPSITSMCEEAGVYWCISMRDITDESIKEIVYASEYYVGYCSFNDVSLGYDMAKAVYDNGGTTYAIITGAVGDSDSDNRELGIQQGAEEFGLEQVAEVRSVASNAEATEAIESILSANPDVDAIINVQAQNAGDGPAMCAAIKNSSRADDLIFVNVNYEDGMDEYFEDGTVTTAFVSLNEFDSVIAATMLVDAVLGTPMSDEKIEISLDFTTIDGSDELEGYSAYYSTTDAPLYSVEEVQELLLGKSLEEFTADVIETFTIQSVIDRKTAQ